MNKKLLLCLAFSILLTFALSLMLVGCSEELPSDESNGSSSKEESATTSSQATSSEGVSSEAESSVQETSSESVESSDEPSDEPAPSEDPPDAPVSSEEPSADSSAEPSDEPDPSDEPSEEPSDEPDPSEESSKEPSDEPASSEDPSEEPSDDPDPSEEPSEEPSDDPVPSEDPSEEPSDDPVPSEDPSEDPPEPDEPSEPEDSSEPEVSEPDGAGTLEDPYLYIPQENQPVTTVSIAPGTSVFYNIYRVGGRDLTIEADGVYVVYEGVTYTSEKGILSLRVENALASMPILFEIGNTGTEARSFSLMFASPLGSMANPEVKDDLTVDSVVSLEEGNEIGYFYRHVATRDGTIRFYLSATVDSVIVVTNFRSYAQRSSGESDNVDDQGRTYFDIEVQAGDELSINMGAVPNRRGKYPATVITWSAEYLS